MSITTGTLVLVYTEDGYKLGSVATTDGGVVSLREVLTGAIYPTHPDDDVIPVFDDDAPVVRVDVEAGDQSYPGADLCMWLTSPPADVWSLAYLRNGVEVSIPSVALLEWIDAHTTRP